MRENFAVIFTTSGLIVIMSMFMNIINTAECQLEPDNDTHVISAFNG